MVDCLTNNVRKGKGRPQATPEEVVDKMNNLIDLLVSRRAAAVVACEVKPQRYSNVWPFNEALHQLYLAKQVRGCRTQVELQHLDRDGYHVKRECSDAINKTYAYGIRGIKVASASRVSSISATVPRDDDDRQQIRQRLKEQNALMNQLTGLLDLPEYAMEPKEVERIIDRVSRHHSASRLGSFSPPSEHRSRSKLRRSPPPSSSRRQSPSPSPTIRQGSVKDRLGYGPVASTSGVSSSAPINSASRLNVPPPRSVFQCPVNRPIPQEETEDDPSTYEEGDVKGKRKRGRKGGKGKGNKKRKDGNGE